MIARAGGLLLATVLPAVTAQVSVSFGRETAILLATGEGIVKLLEIFPD